MTASAGVPATRQALPRSREVLVRLFGQVQDSVEFFERLQHRQQARYDRLISHLRSGRVVEGREQALLAALGDESVKQWAGGLPLIEGLEPYIDHDQMVELIDGLRCADFVMRWRRSPTDVNELRAWLEGLAAMINVMRRQARLFGDLKAQIVEALEDRADTRADTGPKLQRVLPRNPAVLKLWSIMKASPNSEMSENEIAMDFALKYGGNPKSLLRGVRRFKKRLTTR